MDPSSDVASFMEYDDFNEIFTCRCKKTFNTIREWEFHNFHYHMNLKYICNHCNFRYCNINSFRLHMSSEHQQQQYCCSICRNLYSNKQVFEHHIFYCHVSDPTKLGMYICSKCEPWRKILTYEQLNIHDIRKHKYDHIEFICYVCGRKFANFHNLNTHKESHYRKKLRKCVVDTCRGRIFATLIDFRLHIIENHPEKFLCTRCFCNASFMSKEDLQKHVGEYHKDQLELS